jgi:hypothetical protein
MKRSTIPATLARLSPESLRWLNNEKKKIIGNGASSMGLSTALRAIVNGLSEARLNLGSCRSEFEISDRIRDLVRAAISREVSTNA